MSENYWGDLDAEIGSHNYESSKDLWIARADKLREKIAALTSELSTLRGELYAAKVAAYAEGVENTEARASRRIAELEAIAEKVLDPEYMKELGKDRIVAAMAKELKEARAEVEASRAVVKALKKYHGLNNERRERGSVYDYSLYVIGEDALSALSKAQETGAWKARDGNCGVSCEDLCPSCSNGVSHCGCAPEKPGEKEAA